MTEKFLGKIKSILRRQNQASKFVCNEWAPRARCRAQGAHGGLGCRLLLVNRTNLDWLMSQRMLSLISDTVLLPTVVSQGKTPIAQGAMYLNLADDTHQT